MLKNTKTVVVVKAKPIGKFYFYHLVTFMIFR